MRGNSLRWRVERPKTNPILHVVPVFVLHVSRPRRRARGRFGSRLAPHSQCPRLWHHRPSTDTTVVGRRRYTQTLLILHALPPPRPTRDVRGNPSSPSVRQTRGTFSRSGGFWKNGKGIRALRAKRIRNKRPSGNT